MARVMIVDDAVLARKIMRNVLTNGGHDVVGEIGSGDTALETFRQLKPDLVMMDVTMPGKDGVTAGRDILSEIPEAKIVIVSSIHRESVVRDSLGSGVAGYIIKPYTTERILETVDRIVGAGAK